MADQAEGEVYEEGEEWDEEGEWDDEAYEEEGWDDEEWDDDDYEDEEDDYEDEEDDLVLQRCAMGGPNRQRNCGIHTIEIYYPQFYIKQIEMEEWDSQPHRYGPAVIGKYTKGIGQVEGRFPTDDEDPVSFGMSVVHRLVERMERLGMNETSRYNPSGETIPAWNAFGRIDIGSESLIDRSKSMKSYIMDLFERYGDGEGNIEGVDMYNACYGGQAAGLCCLNWVESDRWDGRYGCSIATDISEAHNTHLFTVGASCAGTLFFPDAPLAHHSYRASCILHRFDFFKPVGWRSMAPVVDGKYSIDAYMTCIDMCYEVLKKKMNDRPLFATTDFNVFHTGGGFHIVKKAFERMCRADDPSGSHEQRQQLVQSRLMCSVHLLKIIGPCHTVSSFLNISSIIMSKWEKALGKICIVFTYGSGAASSMYQIRWDDIPWMQPLAAWKIEFYREAIYQHPATTIHDIYCATWMKFDYKPVGRKYFQIDPWKYQLDAYYLMEIDKWGRRFYHRGAIIAPALDPKWRVRVDKAEGRPRREKYDPVPEKPKAAEKILEDRWKEIEYEMTYDNTYDPPEEITQEAYVKGKENHKLVYANAANSPLPQGMSIMNDMQEHSYQICGSWTKWQEYQPMDEEDGNYVFSITMGENMWEEFYIVQDGNPERLIYPAYERSWKGMPCIGPHRGPKEGKRLWRIDARDIDSVPEEDLGRPGDQYLVVFSWPPGQVKSLEWDKQEGEQGEFPRGQYFIAGTWTCWEFTEMQPQYDGRFTFDVQMTYLGLDFVLARDESHEQMIAPEVQLDDEGEPVGKGHSGATVMGPDSLGATAGKWSIEGNPGDWFSITFYRNPEAPEEMELTWAKTGSEAAVEPEPRFFLAGAQNRWGLEGFIEMRKLGNSFVAEIFMTAEKEPFYLLMFKRSDLCVHPDKKDCSQQQAHKVVGPDMVSTDEEGEPENYWAIGKAAADKARVGDTFYVTYDAGERKVTWRKK